jgi:lipopolysaccharide transport system ATP-binding protein
MDDDVAIKVEHVSKKYCKSLKKSMLYGVKDIGRNTVGLSSHSANLRKHEFWAVDDVSFEVKRGETLGIIGPNGSGKTTLLKMLNGIFWPDKGKITVKGKVGALIEVGAGFHPMFTGRENVYINAAILGMTKEEVDEKFDDIIEFADIGDFIDAPLKFYSSGMFVRLGFAVAVHCEPDILLVDELLAVGDIEFRAKCYKRIDEIKNKTTVVIVSHMPETLSRLCEEALLLDGGRKIKQGTLADIQEYYMSNLLKNTYTSKNLKTEIVEKVELMANGIKVVKGGNINITYGDSLQISFDIHFNHYKGDFIVFDIYIINGKNIVCSRFVSKNDQKYIRVINDRATINLNINKLRLSPGKYFVRVEIIDQNGLAPLYIDENAIELLIKNKFESLIFGIYRPDYEWGDM